MKRLALAGALALAWLFAAGPAAAGILISIDKSTQRMSVAVDGNTRYVWTVSTGRAGYGTPNGTFRPQRMTRTWFSKKYYNSPMPHSIFFHHGYAIHGSYEIHRLGGPASHGCVRLHPGNAATLYALVKQEGMAATRIVVSGTNAARGHMRRPRYIMRGQPPAQAPYGVWFEPPEPYRPPSSRDSVEF